jgi:hypothetical protein
VGARRLDGPAPMGSSVHQEREDSNGHRDHRYKLHSPRRQGRQCHRAHSVSTSLAREKTASERSTSTDLSVRSWIPCGRPLPLLAQGKRRVLAALPAVDCGVVQNSPASIHSNPHHKHGDGHAPPLDPDRPDKAGGREKPSDGCDQLSVHEAYPACRPSIAVTDQLLGEICEPQGDQGEEKHTDRPGSQKLLFRHSTDDRPLALPT